MVVCFAADCKHVNRKDKCRFFFGCRVIQRNTISGKTLSIKFQFSKNNGDKCTRHIVNKKLVNHTVSFDNELVPLNGRHILLSHCGATNDDSTQPLVFVPGNGTPSTTNVVVVVGCCCCFGGSCCYQIFKVLRLFHFNTGSSVKLRTYIEHNIPHNRTVSDFQVKF